MVSVHDEIGVSLDPTEVKLIDEIKRIYCDFQSDEAPFKLRVPIECSADVGPNWYIASK
jgi:DNA polymerase I-like protein with 3'-5' exonuclease and polymerase domains